ncbi:MAG: DUF2007 domain-containing protein [Thermoguttaceae bacterium]|jgi:hypothetical protein
MASSEIREVYAAANVQEAYLIASALEDAGIMVHVVGDQLQNAVGDLPAVAINPRLWVCSDDLERARSIIAGLHCELSEPGEETTWTCPECGETNAGTFDLCWKCQHDRDRAESSGD